MKTWLCAAVTAAALTAAGSANALPINFQGSTSGCFGAGCVPGAVSSFLGLSYSGTTFNANTSLMGDLGLGGNPGGTNNLGTFTLAAPVEGTDDYTGGIFNLRVFFTAPAGTSEAETVFSSVLRGSVSALTGGGLRIDFDNAVRNYTFTGGSFTFLVDDVSIFAGQSAVGSGFIQAVPGPIAGAGLPVLLGLAGLVWARRRKIAAAA